MYLFLDDERYPHNVKWHISELNVGMTEIPLAAWDVVRNYNQFVQYIKTNKVPNWVSFDHDLSDIESWVDEPKKHLLNYDTFVEKTGYHCARYLIEYCIDNNCKLPDRVFFHTMNPIGRDKMYSLFISAKNNFDFL